MSMKKWALCVNNEGYPASLELRKVYAVLDDEDGERMGCIRVIDEEGEDYLYPSSMFVALEVSEPVEKRLLTLSTFPTHPAQAGASL
ncbi:hypothetical protein AGMMS49545_21790 [Betaproteobacteria bacterium]|nr:hypothetical protein AGMMS49545_21790 [Betaproteobacteria bacterium]GHU43487.1 hypothetical protein AGMMS50289_09980 [Betaproteobacteria bacterium]